METGTESPRPLLNSSASYFIAPFFGHTWVISEMLSSCSLSQDRATMIEQQTFAVLHNWFHHLFCVPNSMDCVSWIERNIIVFLWPFSGSFLNLYGEVSSVYRTWQLFTIHMSSVQNPTCSLCESCVTECVGYTPFVSSDELPVRNLGCSKRIRPWGTHFQLWPRSICALHSHN
jgi:hypothetical protein